MRSTASRRAWRCCLLWLLALAPAHAQAQQPVVERVSDGQQLADAVAAYGRRNADTTLLVPANTTLRLANATFTSVPDAEAVGGKAFSSGVLTIQGEDSASSVINAGMRAGLLPSQGISTRLLVLRNVRLINTCANVNVRGPGLVLAPVQALLGLFSQESLFRSARYENVSLYSRPAEVRFLGYVLQSQRMPWPLVVERFRRQAETFSNVQTAVIRTTAHSATSATVSAGSWAGTYTTRVSTAKVDDPLLQSMRRDGTLLPLEWCGNGSLVPADVADAPYDPLWGPLLTTDTAGEAVEAMRQQAAAAAQLESGKLPVPAVMVHAPRVDLSRQPVIPLPAPLMLWGPFNDVRSNLLPVPVLDLGGNRSTALFTLSGTGQVFITRLALDGLAPLPLPSITPSAAPLAVSALPLLSLAAPSASAAAALVRVHLHNVTLVVPQQDFLALLTLATDGSAADGQSVRPCVDGSVLQLAAQLSTNISRMVLAPQQNLSGLWRAVKLSGYTGWGVNATQLVVRPHAAVPEALAATCVPATSSSSSSDDSRGVGLSGGAIAGIVVGSVLLLAAAAAAVVALRHRRDDRSSAAYGVFLITSKQASTDPAVLLGSKPSGADTSGSDGHGLVPRGPAAAQDQGGVGGSGEEAAVPRSSVEVAPSLLALLGQAERRLLARTDTVSLAALSHAAAVRPGSEAEAQAPAASWTSTVTLHQQRPPTGASLLGQAHAMLMSGLRGSQGAAPSGGGADGGGAGSSGEVVAASGGSLGAARAGGGGTAAVEGKASADESPRDQSRETTAREAPRDLHPLECVKQLMGEKGTLHEAAKQVNKVVLHDVLGRGASGTVYLGEWRGLPVAVKTMVYEAAPGMEEQAAAIMETAISASVGHRNVVATYHYDIKRVGDNAPDGSQASDGLQVHYLELSPAEQQDSAAPAVAAFKVFLIQELCQSSLQEVLELRGLYDPKCSQLTNQALTVSVLLNVATGLEYLHGLGIIHGDLTPANILLKLDRSEPYGMVAKLADFGLSRRLDAQATHVSNFAAGTPFYVAPEVVHYKRTSPASDVFSFGVIMWQSLTGLAPYERDAQGGLRPNPDFPNLRQDLPLPPALRNALRCLAKDPRLRCSAAEVRRTLEGHLHSLTSPPRPPPPPHPIEDSEATKPHE